MPTLKRAFPEQDTDTETAFKAVLLSVGHKSNGEDGGLYPVWVPKSQIKHNEDGSYNLPSWLVQQLEERIADETGASLVEIEVL